MCKSCYTIERQKWHRDKEAYKRSREKYKKNNPEEYARSQYKHSLKKLYDIDIEEYDRIFNQQKGLCAICGEPERKNKFLSVDHDHKTGRVRGLLCKNCNSALGLLKDDIVLAKNLVSYLEQEENGSI